MKLITTIVRPERLPEVKEALFRAGVTGITLTRVSGHGGEQEVGLARDRHAPDPVIAARARGRGARREELEQALGPEVLVDVDPGHGT